jgi:hypothetical protein
MSPTWCIPNLNQLTVAPPAFTHNYYVDGQHLHSKRSLPEPSTCW